MNDVQELLNRSLVAAEVARQEGFEETAKALQAIAGDLVEEKRRQERLSRKVSRSGDAPPARDKYTT